MEKFGKKCKAHIMDELMAAIKARPNVFVTNYMGLSAAELDALRNELATKGKAAYLVVKNSLTKKVFEKLKLEALNAYLENGVGLGFAGDEMLTACRILAKFAKEHEKLKIKAAILDGRVVRPNRVVEIANLPSREVLTARVVSGIKSPITGFVLTLDGLLRKFLYCVDAVKRQRESKMDVPQNK